MKTAYVLKHSPITQVHFTKNSNDFTVSEIPLYDFTGEGEHLILHVRKKDITTWDMIKVLSEVSGAKARDFGYAGLKDKDGMTIQYISILKKYESSFENFFHDKIKIIQKTYHKNKIKIGHLKSNRFFMRLKKVSKIDAKKLEDGLRFINENGYPNFFGYQRFGKEQNNSSDGLKILSGEMKIKNKKMKKFLISAYQSELFNLWLNHRIELSHLVENFSVKEIKNILKLDDESIKNLKNQKQFLKIFQGDVMHHYPHGKAFTCKDLEDEVDRFMKRQTTLTGWLIGSRAMQSEGIAKEIEEPFFKDALPYLYQMTGSRRFAWSFLENLEYRYVEEDAWFEMNFTLQKGSYATVVLRQLLKA